MRRIKTPKLNELVGAGRQGTKGGRDRYKMHSEEQTRVRSCTARGMSLHFISVMGTYCKIFKQGCDIT